MPHPTKVRPFGSRKNVQGTLPTNRKGNKHRMKTYQLPRDSVLKTLHLT